MSQQSMAHENDDLLHEVQQVLANTEELLHAASGEGGEKLQDLRQRVGANLAQAKARLREAEQAISDKARAAAKATDQYVHENPWKSIGIAAGVGLLLGMLISRR